TVVILSIVLILAQTQSLPGLDYIKSGYDGLKILNDQLGQSKYPIFNLDPSNGETDFQINGVNYKVPIIIQATEQSVRKETQCEGIYYPFSDFQKKYSESISFSAGLGISNFTISFGINHQLDTFHQQITQSNKAISVSQSYWAMYSISTAPAFLMPLNPMFKQSLDALNRMAKDPQNDTQQTIYNQVVSSFGTHYVSSVIMGGSAKIYTTLDQNYLKAVDYEEARTQIGIDFSYQVFKFKFGYNSTEIGQKLHENFKKNAEDVIVFSPEVDHLQDPKAWETWESAVPQKPQPLNTTVSYISDLAYEYPEVQAHLRKTIDFYLKNGKLPSFAEIQGFQIVLQEQVPQSTPKTPFLFAKRYLYKVLSSSIVGEAVQELCPFPGYYGTYCPQENYAFSAQKRQLQQSIPRMPSGIGASFDISTGELKLPAIQLTYQQEPSQEQIYKDPLSNNQYIVADETSVEYINLDADVKIFKNEFELTNIWIDAVKNGQWLGGEYSKSKDLNEVFDKFFKGNQQTSISQQAKNVVRLTFKTENLKLNKFAQRAIDSLPEEFKPEIYNKFLNSWGTHIAVDIIIGGMIEKQIVFKDCIYANPSFTGGLSADQVVQALHNELHGNPADGYFAARRQLSIDHKFGGNPEDVANWESTISQNPALLKINRFISWDNMTGNPQVKQNLQQAIQIRIEQMKQRQESYQAQVREERRIQNNGPRIAYGFQLAGPIKFGNSGAKIDVPRQIRIRSPFELKEASLCPPGVPYQSSKNICSSGNMETLDQIVNEVRYERDDQGNFRTVVNNFFVNGGGPVEFYGNWVSRGCSNSQVGLGSQYSDLNQPPPNEYFKMTCTDCIPTVYNSPQGDVLQCNCPGF
ncbi:hypothetical protein ABPG72_016169, partial [Tetrahymena utriculariae]